MAEGQPAVADGQQPAGAAKKDPPGLMSRLMNMMIMYWLVTSGIQYFTGNNANKPGSVAGSNAVSTGAGGAVTGGTAGGAAQDSGYQTTYIAAAKQNMMFKMKIRIGAKYQPQDALVMTEEGSAASKAAEIVNDENGAESAGSGSEVAATAVEEAAQEEKEIEWVPVPGFKEVEMDLTPLVFSLDEGTEEKQLDLNITSCLETNCTIHAHVEYTSLADRAVKVNYSIPLVFHFTEKVKQLRNLFDEEAPEPLADNNKTTTKSFLQQTITVCPVIDFTTFADPGTPAQIKDWLHLIPSTITYQEIEDNKPPHRRGKYLPIIYNNDFWVMKSQMQELNETTPEILQLNVTHYPLSLWKFMLYSQMDQAFNMHESTGLMGKGERDETKRIFAETNPYFLGLTMCVSMLHLVFEYLAFSNDVSFWKSKKDFKGLSLRTVALNCYFQTIIFLYLLDGDVTSWTVYAPAGIGVLIEYWKLRKVIVISKNPETGRWNVEFKYNDDEKSKTRTYDQQAMKYLTWVLVPGIIGYSGYSAVYHTYKGWYSFFIATQVRFIYFSGFIMMTPQIFINYKMKSVSALPWRTFVYKALNTFIDDMFAFIITMPTMHRLACFRDDIIFFILLYQRYIYPVDKSRTEHGEIDVEEEKEKSDDNTKVIEEKKATDEDGEDEDGKVKKE